MGVTGDCSGIGSEEIAWFGRWLGEGGDMGGVVVVNYNSVGSKLCHVEFDVGGDGAGADADRGFLGGAKL